MSVRPSVPIYRLGSHWTYFREILYLDVCEGLSRNTKFGRNRIKISRTLHEGLSSFFIVAGDINFAMKELSCNVQDFLTVGRWHVAQECT
jgi:hypothetical protein